MEAAKLLIYDASKFVTLLSSADEATQSVKSHLSAQFSSTSPKVKKEVLNLKLAMS